MSSDRDLDVFARVLKQLAHVPAAVRNTIAGTPEKGSPEWEDARRFLLERLEGYGADAASGADVDRDTHRLLVRIGDDVTRDALVKAFLERIEELERRIGHAATIVQLERDRSEALARELAALRAAAVETNGKRD